MNRNLLIALIICALGFAGLLIFGGEKNADLTPKDNTEVIPNENDTNDDAVTLEINRVLALLPHQFTEDERSTLLDRQTVPNAARNQFSLRQGSTLPREGDDPVEYIERIVRFRINTEAVVNPPEGLIYKASFYPIDGGVVAILNTSNFQDDSVGKTEERMEFQYTAGGWKLVWYGERSFCMRPQPGNWQPADQLCP